MKNKFYMWWVSILFIGTGVFWAGYTGSIQYIWNSDVTYITSLIILAFLIGNICIGYASYIKSSDGFIKDKTNKVDSLFDTAWFLSEVVMGLGMLGTVIGIIILSDINKSVDVSNGQALNLLITKMMGTLGLALWPNAIGLIGSLTMKVQAHFLSKE